MIPIRSNAGELFIGSSVLKSVMDTKPQAPQPQTIRLSQGAQVVINGALVTASGDCELEVGSGAVVISGRTLWRGEMRNPHEELYFSMLDASRDADYFEEERFRLFALLSQVVTQDRTHEAQKECTLCASALLAGEREEATKSAARLAAMRLDKQSAKRRKVPGLAGDKRRATGLAGHAHPLIM